MEIEKVNRVVPFHTPRNKNCHTSRTERILEIIFNNDNITSSVCKSYSKLIELLWTRITWFEAFFVCRYSDLFTAIGNRYNSVLRVIYVSAYVFGVVWKSNSTKFSGFIDLLLPSNALFKWVAVLVKGNVSRFPRWPFRGEGARKSLSRCL